jgi:hypothetical protein
MSAWVSSQRRAVVALIVGVCWLASAAAQAQALRSLDEMLRLQSGASCLEKSRLVSHIAAWLGTGRVDSRLTVAVEGSATSARNVRFRIERSGATFAERSFDPGPERCEDLHAAVAIAIALALKASLLEALTKLTETVANATAAPRWALALDGVAGVAVLPGVAFGASLELQRELIASVSARLSVFGLRGLGATFPRTRPAGFDPWLGSARLDACDAFQLASRLRLSACIGVALGALYIVGHDLQPRSSAAARYVALANALDLRVDLGAAWSLRLALSTLLPLERASVVVRARDTSLPVDSVDIAAIGVMLSLGPLLRF